MLEFLRRLVGKELGRVERFADSIQTMHLVVDSQTVCRVSRIQVRLNGFRKAGLRSLLCRYHG